MYNFKLGKSKSSLDGHVNAIHRNLRVFSCGLCDYSACRRWTLRRHLAFRHKDDPRTTFLLDNLAAIDPSKNIQIQQDDEANDSNFTQSSNRTTPDPSNINNLILPARGNNSKPNQYCGYNKKSTGRPLSTNKIKSSAKAYIRNETKGSLPVDKITSLQVIGKLLQN